jgi:hypothetical protein
VRAALRSQFRTNPLPPALLHQLAEKLRAFYSLDILVWVANIT